MIGNPNVIGSLILKIAGAKATLVIFLFCFSFEKIISIILVLKQMFPLQ